jgi:primary-amine oxidase
LVCPQRVLTSKTRIISIILREPAKECVHNWPKAPKPAREADAVLFDNGWNVALVLRVNLDAGKVVCIGEASPSSQPTMSIDEQVECEKAVLASPEFKAALKRHCGTDCRASDGRHMECRQQRLSRRSQPSSREATLLPGQ